MKQCAAQAEDIGTDVSAFGVFGLFGSLFGTGMLLLGPRLAGGLVLGTALAAFVIAARLGEKLSS